VRGDARTALASLALLALAACGGPEPRGRVLLVGIDGASPRVATPMLADGRLPNLARLAREGVSGPLRSRLPLASPRIWNTIVTGKRPEKHGIRSFVRREGDRLELLLSSDRRTHALWNIASDAGLSAGVVNFWNTHPPERISGVMVSDHLLASEVEGRRTLAHAAAAPRGPLVFPEAWQPRLAQLLAAGAEVVDVADPFAGATGLPPRLFAKGNPLSERFREDEALAAIALAIDAELRPDLLMVLLPGIDRVSHLIWAGVEPAERYAPPQRPTPPEHAAMRAALEAYYAYTDALVGALAARFGPDDLVLVLSDHGFEAGVSMGFLTGVHESEAAADGVLFARGPGVPAGGAAGEVAIEDVTPTVLAWLGLPLGLDMDGRPAAFLAAAPTRSVATWDAKPVERLPLAESGAEPELVERLRDLGYLE
jgi:predicted AlkP superfamily phosphohydrolase/phosphomutase